MKRPADNNGSDEVLWECWEEGREDCRGKQKEIVRQTVSKSFRDVADGIVCVIHDVIRQLQPDGNVRVQAPGSGKLLVTRTDRHW